MAVVQMLAIFSFDFHRNEKQSTFIKEWVWVVKSVSLQTTHRMRYPEQNKDK